MRNPPKTARELCALVESLLVHLPLDEQKRFWLLITENSKNVHHNEVMAFLTKSFGSIIDIGKTGILELIEDNNDLWKLLKKHRRPIKNAERDAEIIRLHREGKTSGQIARLLNSRWPTIRPNSVRRVIARKGTDSEFE